MSAERDPDAPPEAPADAPSNAPPSDVLRIRLTEYQQEQVKAETGREMEVLELGDERGDLTDRMEIATPEDVQIWAIRKARRLNEDEAAHYAWLVALAKDQDEEKLRAKKQKDLEKQIAKDVKKEQRRIEAEFKLIAAGKMPPKKKGGGKKGGGKGR